MPRPKKRRTVEVIESTPRPEIEHQFYKVSHFETEDDTDYERSSENRTYSKGKLSYFAGNYTSIHTPPHHILMKRKKNFFLTVYLH